MVDPIIKKMAEATNGGGKTILITLWSDQVMTECQPVDDGAREFECGEREVSVAEPGISFFVRLGELERQGHRVRVLYDSEGVGFTDVRTLLES